MKYRIQIWHFIHCQQLHVVIIYLGVCNISFAYQVFQKFQILPWFLVHLSVQQYQFVPVVLVNQLDLIVLFLQTVQQYHVFHFLHAAQFLLLDQVFQQTQIRPLDQLNLEVLVIQVLPLIQVYQLTLVYLLHLVNLVHLVNLAVPENLVDQKDLFAHLGQTNPVDLVHQQSLVFLRILTLLVDLALQIDLKFQIDLFRQSIQLTQQDLWVLVVLVLHVDHQYQEFRVILNTV